MEEMVVVKNDMFVEPHFIESLACDGLTDVEVAQSLGIDVRDVRKKLREGFIHTMESFGFSWVEPLTLKNINGVEYTAYSMSTECAQFFVGSYDNSIGRAYLGYLIRFEGAAKKILLKASEERTKLLEENALLKTKLLGQKDQTLLLAEQSTLKDKLKEAETKIGILTEETRDTICMYSTFYNTIMREIKKQAKMLFNWGGPKAMELIICNRMMERFNIEVLYELRVIDYALCLKFIKRFEQDSLGGDFKAKRTAREFYEGIREKPTHF